jgi:acetylornithine deacetylase/succinyl-diaminopimelate desuccinylase-like protein
VLKLCGRCIAAACVALLAWSGAGAHPAGDAQDAARSYVARHGHDLLREFMTLLAIPNVASDADNIRRNAVHIAGMLEERGVAAKLLEVEGGAPAVHGELRAPGAGFTLMVYAHYDGQPVTVSDWASPPWQPVLRDGRLEDGAKDIPAASPGRPLDPDWRVYARSAGDDKAPIVAALHALDALAAAGIPRAVNLEFFFEGEEEAGSPHLGALLDRHAGALAADLWLFCDGPRHQSGRPQLAFGVRGVAGMDLTVFGPARALHSGHYGNWAPNPAAMLAHLLAGMRAPDGRILIEGVDNAVRPPTPAELAAVAAAPPVDAQLRREFELGESEGGGARLELLLLEPALNVKGLRAGAVGDAAPNAIPVSATAALGFRLVPDLTPARLRELVEAHVRAQGYRVLREPPDAPARRAHGRIAQIDWHDSGYPAVRTDMASAPARALIDVMRRVAGDELVLMPTMGGSLPLYLIGERLGAPVVILPIANHDNNQHAANENLRLGNLFEAVATYAAVFAGLAPAGH